MENFMDILNLHRYRNGRSEIDYFSRQLRPRYSLIEIDGKYYDREKLRKYIINQGSAIAPETLKAMNKKNTNNTMNTNPWRIFGKAKILKKNLA
jgi:hypothetical protein